MVTRHKVSELTVVQFPKGLLYSFEEEREIISPACRKSPLRCIR